LDAWNHENDEKLKKLYALHETVENINKADYDSFGTTSNMMSNTTFKSASNFSKMNHSRAFSQAHYMNQTLDYFPTKSQFNPSMIKERINNLKEELDALDERIENEQNIQKQIFSMMGETRRSKVNTK
jgi:hypothetical protein